jgi:CubicO group peptidase (beta-lactamase class C family)
MSVFPELDIVPASVASRLNKLLTRQGAEKARAHATNAKGETILSVGDTSLPIVLMQVTQLFTLAMVLREFDRGAMAPETPIADLLPEDMVRGLCVVDGTDHSESITVDQLISHCSGISDYFSPPGHKVLSLKTQTESKDRAWSLEQALEISRHYPGQFVPGTARKLCYSHTNYLLLGEILQESTGMPYEQLVNLRLVSSLGLRDTYVFTPNNFDRYFSITPTLHKGTLQRAPRTLASFGASGSVISTSRDVTRFLRGFWSGELFNERWRTELLASPRFMGRGLRLSRGVMIVNTTGKKPQMIGHASSSGAVALINTATGSTGFATTNSSSAQPHLVTEFAKVMAHVDMGR